MRMCETLNSGEMEPGNEVEDRKDSPPEGGPLGPATEVFWLGDHLRKSEEVKLEVLRSRKN